MKNGNRYMLMADGALLLVSIIWGATNVVMRGALEGIPPFWFCAFRFFVASAAVMAAGVTVLGRSRRLSHDTAIGLLFVGMLALGVIIVSHSRTFATVTHRRTRNGAGYSDRYCLSS